jgi:hypothetical protein
MYNVYLYTISRPLKTSQYLFFPSNYSGLQVAGLKIRQKVPTPPSADFVNFPPKHTLMRNRFSWPGRCMGHARGRGVEATLGGRRVPKNHECVWFLAASCCIDSAASRSPPPPGPLPPPSPHCMPALLPTTPPPPLATYRGRSGCKHKDGEREVHSF